MIMAGPPNLPLSVSLGTSFRSSGLSVVRKSDSVDTFLAYAQPTICHPAMVSWIQVLLHFIVFTWKRNSLGSDPSGSGRPPSLHLVGLELSWKRLTVPSLPPAWLITLPFFPQPLCEPITRPFVFFFFLFFLEN